MTARLASGIPALAVAAALVAAGTQAATGNPPRVAVVVGGPAASNPAVVQRAGALARGAQAQLRVPRTPTEELAVTHLLAVQGYDAIVGIDLDRRISVAPVARRFAHVRFMATGPAALAAAVRAAGEGRRG
jgi:hypothetical protein